MGSVKQDNELHSAEAWKRDLIAAGWVEESVTVWKDPENMSTKTSDSFCTKQRALVMKEIELMRSWLDSLERQAREDGVIHAILLTYIAESSMRLIYGAAMNNGALISAYDNNQGPRCTNCCGHDSKFRDARGECNYAANPDHIPCGHRCSLTQAELEARDST